jgi:hypothetical protein
MKKYSYTEWPTNKVYKFPSFNHVKEKPYQRHKLPEANSSSARAEIDKFLDQYTAKKGNAS